MKDYKNYVEEAKKERIIANFEWAVRKNETTGEFELYGKDKNSEEDEYGYIPGSKDGVPGLIIFATDDEDETPLGFIKF